MRSRQALFIGSILLSASGFASAQTNAEMLIKPWATEQLVEQSTEALYMGEADIGGSDEEVQISEFESKGRVRLMPGERASPRLGYDMLYMNLDTDFAGLPNQLWDFSVAAGLAIGQFDGWIAGITVGVGYAGDAPFSNGRSYYGLAAIGVAKELGKDKFLGIILDYDGNRAIFPDIPLPGIVYGFRIDERLRASVGFPVSSVTWEPNEQFTAELNFFIAGNFEARLTYRPFEHFSIFGAYLGRNEAFHVDKVEGNNRLLFEQRRLEAGARWETTEYFGIGAAVGYAFNQEFRSGFDARKSDVVADLSDELYLKIEVSADF